MFSPLYQPFLCRFGDEERLSSPQPPKLFTPECDQRVYFSGPSRRRIAGQ
jgi:hypothetical protein